MSCLILHAHTFTIETFSYALHFCYGLFLTADYGFQNRLQFVAYAVAHSGLCHHDASLRKGYHLPDEITFYTVIHVCAVHVFEHGLHYAVHSALIFTEVFAAVGDAAAAAQRFSQVFNASGLIGYDVLCYAGEFFIVCIL